MDKQQQYYNAKIFLRHYSGAIQTLQQCSKQLSSIKYYQLGTKNLVHAVSQNYIKINESKNHQVTKTKNYKGSKPYNMAKFTNNLFLKYLPSFKEVHSYGHLAKMLGLGLDLMRREVNEDN